MSGSSNNNNAAGTLALERQLCFALYACAHQMQRLYRPWLDQLGLTYPQYLVMLRLWEHGTQRVGDLAAALHLDSGTLSPLLRRMEAAGWLQRRRAAEDERSVEVSLSMVGQALRERAQGLPERVAAAACLSGDEIGDLRERLQALLTRLAAADRSDT